MSIGLGGSDGLKGQGRHRSRLRKGFSLSNRMVVPASGEQDLCCVGEDGESKIATQEHLCHQDNSARKGTR